MNTTESAPTTAADGVNTTSEATAPTEAATNREPEATPQVENQSAGGTSDAGGNSEQGNVSDESMPSLLATADGEEAGEVQQAPAEYDEFKLPDGIPLNNGQLGSVVSMAKELGLSQDKAQRLVDSVCETHRAFISDVSRANANAWGEQARNDKEYGGEKFKENLAIAGRAFKTYASPKLQEELVRSGLSNHPEVIRLFLKIGRETSQDRGVRGEASSPSAPISRYPKSNMVID